MLGDPLRWHLLGVVRSLGLPDGWIGAGFVRNAVWDALHGRSPAALAGDIDVVWFDPSRCDEAEDDMLQAALASIEPGFDWSVRNQSRMHRRNGDAPYASTADAMRFWPETATAVAVRRTGEDDCEIAAPYGLDDLFALRLVPTPAFRGAKRGIFRERMAQKRWLSRWRRLTVEPGP
ncbi:MAG: hypothetical protein GC201_00500 [Alphaproteobacteria bacterium]|nr:hypothetical protein [Alphaproteobacteria bacterium]